MKLTEHAITVTRDITHTIHRKAWEHELPILRQLHGSDNIAILSSEEVEVHGFNVNDEYLRLKRYYNKKDDGNTAMVERVYGTDAMLLATRLGITRVPSANVVQKSAHIDHRETGPKVRGLVQPKQAKAEVPVTPRRGRRPKNDAQASQQA
jgi:hypothetical protein